MTFGRPDWHDTVATEVEAATQRAAISDVSSFGKIDVTGPDAEAFLLQSGAGYMVRAAGSVIYTSVLNARGTFLSDITAQRIADDHYRLFVGTNAIKRDLAHFTQASAGFDVQLKDTTERYGVLCLCRERGMVVSAIISCLLRHLLRLKARLTAPWTALRGRSTR